MLPYGRKFFPLREAVFSEGISTRKVTYFFLLESTPFEPQSQKTYLLTYASSEDSDQTTHSRSLIITFTGRILDNQGCEVLRADNENSDQTVRI